MKNVVGMRSTAIVLVIILLALTGCGAPAQPQPSQAAAPTTAPAADAPTTAPAAAAEGQEVFRLGVLAPYTGPAALTGQEFRGSVEIAFDKINWQIGKYKIEPVWIDSQSDPAKAAQAYEQAVVQDGIKAGILNWHSSVAVACMEVTAKHKIPHISGFGATEVVNEKFNSDREKYGYWSNKWWATADKLTSGYVEVIEAAIADGRWQPESKTLAIFGEDTDWGRSFAQALKKRLEEKGWTTVNEEYFATDQAEFYPWLNKLIELNPGIVAGTHTGAPAFAGLLNQADELGLKSLIIAEGLGRFGEWYELTGKSSNFVLDQLAPAFAGEEGDQYLKAFEERYGFTPSASAGGLAYDGAQFFIAIAQQVYEQEGELTSENIQAFIEDKIWTGEWSFKDGIVMEEYKYTPESIPDPVVGAGYYIFPIVQFIDGEAKIVYPPNLADAPLEFKP